MKIWYFTLSLLCPLTLSLLLFPPFPPVRSISFSLPLFLSLTLSPLCLAKVTTTRIVLPFICFLPACLLAVSEQFILIVNNLTRTINTGLVCTCGYYYSTVILLKWHTHIPGMYYSYTRYIFYRGSILYQVPDMNYTYLLYPKRARQHTKTRTHYPRLISPATEGERRKKERGQEVQKARHLSIENYYWREDVFFSKAIPGILLM